MCKYQLTVLLIIIRIHTAIPTIRPLHDDFISAMRNTLLINIDLIIEVIYVIIQRIEPNGFYQWLLQIDNTYQYNCI